jgi:hypothetical protein
VRCPDHQLNPWLARLKGWERLPAGYE